METMDRRDFLRFGGRGLGYAAVARALAGCGGGGGNEDGPPPDEPPVTDTLPAASAESQWLKRTSFGVTPESLSDIQSLGIEAYLEQQLNPGVLDDLAVETQVALRFPLANAGPTVLRAGYPDNQITIVQHIEAATYFRAYFSPRQLYEVMVEFWHTHFSIQILNGVAPIFHPSYDADVIRPNALGRFGELLRECGGVGFKGLTRPLRLVQHVREVELQHVVRRGRAQRLAVEADRLTVCARRVERRTEPARVLALLGGSRQRGADRRQIDLPPDQREEDQADQCPDRLLHCAVSLIGGVLTPQAAGRAAPDRAAAGARLPVPCASYIAGPAAADD